MTRELPRGLPVSYDTLANVHVRNENRKIQGDTWKRCIWYKGELIHEHVVDDDGLANRWIENDLVINHLKEIGVSGIATT